MLRVSLLRGQVQGEEPEGAVAPHGTPLPAAAHSRLPWGGQVRCQVGGGGLRGDSRVGDWAMLTGANGSEHWALSVGLFGKQSQTGLQWQRIRPAALAPPPAPCARWAGASTAAIGLKD